MNRSTTSSPSQPDLAVLKAEHGLKGHYQGEASRRELQAIADARPTVGQAVEELKRRPGVKISESKDGEVTLTASGLRELRTIAEMTGEARRLETMRGDRNLSLRNLIEVKDRRSGRRRRINVENERAMARQGMIAAAPRYGGVRLIEGRDGELFRVLSGGQLEGTGKVYVGMFPTPLQEKKQREFERRRAHRHEILEMMKGGARGS